jgi:hypothetical protein
LTPPSTSSSLPLCISACCLSILLCQCLYPPLPTQTLLLLLLMLLMLLACAGRNMESPGEDAFVNGEYGAHVVMGGQGALPNGTYPYPNYRKALKEMKHFTAYSVEQGRNGPTDDFNISLRDLDEYYFAPLKACVTQADVASFMCRYVWAEMRFCVVDR